MLFFFFELTSISLCCCFNGITFDFSCLIMKAGAHTAINRVERGKLLLFLHPSLYLSLYYVEYVMMHPFIILVLFFPPFSLPSVLQWCMSIAPGWRSLCRRRGWSTKRQKKVTLKQPKHDTKGWIHYPAPTFLFKIGFGKMS